MIYLKSYTVGGIHYKTREYQLWKNIKLRCNFIYSDKVRNSRYKECKFSDNFKDFQYFANWCNKQIGFNSKDSKGNYYYIDKDICVTGNKIYGEDTCVFVPQVLNQFSLNTKSRRGKYPIGVYWAKQNKKFRAAIGINNVQYILGLVDTEEEAFNLYKIAKEKAAKDFAKEYETLDDLRVIDFLNSFKVQITD